MTRSRTILLVLALVGAGPVACSGDEAAAPDSGAFLVGGNVTGLAASGLVLQNNGGDDLTVGSNGEFTFDTPVTDGASYAVTVAVQPAGQTCVVAAGRGTINGADVTGVLVTCTTDPPPPPTFSVGGVCLCDVSAANPVVLVNNDADQLTLTSGGDFFFGGRLLDGSNYDVTVSVEPTGLVCSVENGSGIISGANVTDVTVTCQNPPQFTVGGAVTGLTGTGLVLQNRGGDDLGIAPAGGPVQFTFDTGLTDGAPYSVTVLSQPTGPAQTCIVNNGSGFISGADVNNVDVQCS